MNDDQRDYVAAAVDAAAKLALLWAVARPLFGESEASRWTIVFGGAVALGFWAFGFYVLKGKGRDEDEGEQ